MEKINTFLTPRNIATLCLIAFFAIVFAQCAFGQKQLSVTVPEIFYFPETKPAPQKYPWKSQLKKSILPGSLALLSGAAGGLHEGLQFRRTEFFRAFPRANRAYWDTDISSEERGWILGQAQDGYHHSADLQIAGIFASGVSSGAVVLIPIIRKEKRPWWHASLDITIQSAVFWIGYFAGQAIVYDVILHR